MPYITQERRRELDGGQEPWTAGELNYVLTRTCIRFLMRRHEIYQDQPENLIAHPLNYGDLNEVAGALDLCKAEFQRRVVGCYENAKMQQNGDVYEQLLDRMGLLPVRPFRGRLDT